MSAARRAGPAACHHTSIHDLPDPLIVHVFSFLERRDSLSVLLVSKAWLAVAGEHCGALWDGLRVDGDRVYPEGALAKRGFQSGFKKRAPTMSNLHMLGRSKAFAALLPSLLQSLIQPGGGSRLRELDLEVAFSKRRHYIACCKVVAQLTALRRLRLKLTQGQEQNGVLGESLPMAPLLQLSSLSCLEGLAVEVPYQRGDPQVVSALLPSLACLTQLAWDARAYPFDAVKVWWQRPDGSGPSLKHLHLGSCSLGMPEGDAGGMELLLHSLQRIERLQLEVMGPVEVRHLADVLPQLPALTSLNLMSVLAPPDVRQGVLEAALHCPHLHDLSLMLHSLGAADRLLRQPLDSLCQLTKLELRVFNGAALPAWNMPQLKQLQVLVFGEMDLQPLALNPTVEELVLYGLVHIGQATRAISELVCLTRLAITTWSRQGVELHGGPYLAGLKTLALHLTYDEGAYHALAPALEQATSLERLDLSGDRWLELQRQDVHLLAKLPSLKTVRLPVPGPGEVWGVHRRIVEYNAAVVKYMQEELGQAGVSVEAVPVELAAAL